jgi:hypothetical protein
MLRVGGDARAEALEAGGIRRTIASVRVGRPLGPGSIVAARPLPDRFAWMGVASQERPTAGLGAIAPHRGPGWARDAFRVIAIARPLVTALLQRLRTQASRRARPDGRIARMMRKPNPTTLTAAVALLIGVRLLVRHASSRPARRRGLLVRPG